MFSTFWDKISSIVAPVASNERLFHHWIEVKNTAKARALLEGRMITETTHGIGTETTGMGTTQGKEKRNQTTR